MDTFIMNAHCEEMATEMFGTPAFDDTRHEFKTIASAKKFFIENATDGIDDWLLKRENARLVVERELALTL